MRARSIPAFVVAAIISVVLGCKGGGGASECTYKHQNPAFCLSPPAGWQARQEATYPDGTSLDFVNATATLELKWGGNTPFDSTINAMRMHPGPGSSTTLVAEGDLPNAGYWKHTTSMNNGKLEHHVVYLAKGKAAGVQCQAGSADVATFDAMMTACKSLRVD